MNGQLEWTPDNYPPPERVALREALSIARRSELILETGWTPAQLDAQDSREIERFEVYLRIRAGLRREQESLEASRRRNGR